MKIKPKLSQVFLENNGVFVEIGNCLSGKLMIDLQFFINIDEIVVM